jgi:hypothetical protein
MRLWEKEEKRRKRSWVTFRFISSLYFLESGRNDDPSNGLQYSVHDIGNPHRDSFPRARLDARLSAALHTCQLKKEGMRICNPTQHQQHTMQEREEEEKEKFPLGPNSYYYFSLSSIRVATGAMNLLTV